MKKSEKSLVWGRFYVVKEGNWCLVDSLDGTLLGHDTKKEALESKSFAIHYVRLHGDIDLCSFPYSIDTPLNYDKWDGREREYREDLYIVNENKS
jgi:hypothetical protein